MQKGCPAPAAHPGKAASTEQCDSMLGAVPIWEGETAASYPLENNEYCPDKYIQA